MIINETGQPVPEAEGDTPGGRGSRGGESPERRHRHDQSAASGASRSAQNCGSLEIRNLLPFSR
jgi:hypothetical protein